MSPSPAPAAVASPQPALPRLLHLQILRAVAASLVVVDHAIGALVYRGYPAGQFVQAGYLLGHIGVCAFFVLSGFIMMRQSSAMFGVPGSPLLFAWHRILRIVPLYWLATIVWFLAKLGWHNPTPHARTQMLLSLFFLPNVANSENLLHPILEPGWTLNYEMAFYLLFALCLFLPLKRAIPVVVGTLTLLVACGSWFHLPVQHHLLEIENFYTDWLILLFAAGVLIGFIEIKLGRVGRINLPLSPAFLLLLPATVLFRIPPSQLHSGFLWRGAAIFSGAVMILCTIAKIERPGGINRTLVLLGDASFSTYLFHLLTQSWALPYVFRFGARFSNPSVTILSAVVVLVVVANLVGLAIHLAIERPITKALRRLPFHSRARTAP